MILVVPVSDADFDQAENLFIRIKQLGGVQAKMLVPMSWKAYWDKDKLERILPEAWYWRLPSEEEIGWPESSNHMFYNTAWHIAKNYFPDSWYFMEADTYPLKKGWFETLKHEYDEAGKPYMGVISNTVRKVDGEIRVTGKHMTGTAIYPADFLDRCRAIHYLMRDPWDIEIAPEVVPDCHDTKAIAHRWGSSGYYMKDGIINVTSSRSPSLTHIQQIPPEAVVVHGCKDGSIYALDLPLVVE